MTNRLWKCLRSIVSPGITHLGVAALLACSACSKPRQTSLETADMAALTKLSKEFAATASRPAAQVQYIDPVSLEKYMRAHQELLRQWDFYGPDGILDRFVTFSPNIATTLHQKVPEKYFASFTQKAPFTQSRDLREGKVAAISIEKDQAYVVFELPPEKDSGLCRPVYFVQPAVRTAGGWRMDVTSTHVRICNSLAKLFQ